MAPCFGACDCFLPMGGIRICTTVRMELTHMGRARLSIVLVNLDNVISDGFLEDGVAECVFIELLARARTHTGARAPAIYQANASGSFTTCCSTPSIADLLGPEPRWCGEDGDHSCPDHQPGLYGQSPHVSRPSIFITISPRTKRRLAGTDASCSPSIHLVVFSLTTSGPECHS